MIHTHETEKQKEERLKEEARVKAHKTSDKKYEPPDSEKIKADALARGESYAKAERLRAEAARRGELNSELDTHTAEKLRAEDEEARFKVLQNETPEQRVTRLKAERDETPKTNEERLKEEKEYRESNSGPGAYGHDGVRIKK